MPVRPLPLRALVLPLALAALAAAPDAQITRKPWPPGGADLRGGQGDTVLEGTTGGDRLMDIATGDVDVLRDAPDASDGALDLLDARDGDGHDTLEGGPEDRYQADDGDRIVIRATGSTKVLWAGTWERYRRAQAVLRWARDRFRQALALLDGPATPSFWQATFADVQDELADLVPQDGIGEPWVLFDEVFAIGPYVWGDVPPSPEGCNGWLPFAEDVDPVEATTGFGMTGAELQEAAADVHALLDHLIASVG